MCLNNKSIFSRRYATEIFNPPDAGGARYKLDYNHFEVRLRDTGGQFCSSTVHSLQ